MVEFRGRLRGKFLGGFARSLCPGLTSFLRQTLLLLKHLLKLTTGGPGILRLREHVHQTIKFACDLFLLLASLRGTGRGIR